MNDTSKSKEQVNPVDVIKRAYAETDKLNFGDPENEKHKALHLLNEVQDILGIYLEGEHEMWREEYALQQREEPWVRVEDGLPPKKEGWQHSNMCLVWYNGQPNVNVETYGIAYYNYEPPLNYPPEWVDFHNYGRKPTHWQALLPPHPQKIKT